MSRCGARGCDVLQGRYRPLGSRRGDQPAPDCGGDGAGDSSDRIVRLQS